MTKRATLNGAGGFVGGQIAAGLLAAGWRVAAVDMSFEADARARLQGAELVEVDLAEGFPDLPRADLVIHAAALTTDAAALGITPAAHIRANTTPLLAALVHAAATGAGGFVFLSSTGVFAPTDGEPDLSDACTPTATHPYAAAKRAGELLVPAALAGLCPAHVVRLGYLYGPGEVARPTRTNLSLVRRWCDAAERGEALTVPVRRPPPRLDLGARPRARAPPPRGLRSGRPSAAPDLGPHPVGRPARPAHRAQHPPHHRPHGPAIGGKPPALPSAIPALDGFRWTAPEDGLAALMAERTAA
jgi:UDP-glucose 4-epimerase